MPVAQLILENFKSYGGRHVIPFDAHFTSIVGPNGSGKSNLMDALSFVLGVSSRDLRSSQLRDLIWRAAAGTGGVGEEEDRPQPKKGNRKNDDSEGGSEDDDDDDEDRDEDEEEEENTKAPSTAPTAAHPKKKKRRSSGPSTPKRTTTAPYRASATLVYHHNNNHKDDDEDDDSNNSSVGASTTTTMITTFARIISPKGQGSFQVNHKTVSWDIYQDQLKSIGVLVRVKNCLVFQGDVETLARKKPTELVQLVEEISGSAELANEYNTAFKTKTVCEQHQLDVLKQQKIVKTERKAAKSQREEAERFQTLLRNKQSLQTEFYLWTLYQLQLKTKEVEEQKRQVQVDAEAWETQTVEATSKLSTYKQKLGVSRRAHGQAHKQRVRVQATLDQLETSMVTIQHEITDVQSKLRTDQKQLQHKKQLFEKSHDKLTSLQQDIDEAKQTLTSIEDEYDAVKKQQPQRLTPEQEEQYELVRQRATVASSQARSQLHALQRTLDASRLKAAEQQQDLELAKSTCAEAERDVHALRERTDKLNQVRYCPIGFGIR